MPDKEFKIAILKKLNKMQEKSEIKYKEIRHKIQDINEKFTKERDLKKKQAEILETKINWRKYKIHLKASKTDWTKQRNLRAWRQAFWNNAVRQHFFLKKKNKKITNKVFKMFEPT